MEQLWPDVATWVLKAAAIGALFAVDGQAVLHLVASQPIVVGVITGWALGDPRLGLVLGSYLQLIWAYGLPRGRVPGPDTSAGTVAGVVAASAFSSGVSGGHGHLALAIVVAIGVARLGSWTELYRRRINGALVSRALGRLNQGEVGAIGRAQGMGVAITAIRGGLTAAIGAALGIAAGSLLINLLAGMDFGLAFALIPCLGLASFILGVVRAKRMELAGFAAGLAAALLIGLKFGLS